MPVLKFDSVVGWISSLIKFSPQTQSPHLLTVLVCITGLIVQNGLFGDLPHYQFGFEIGDNSKVIPYVDRNPTTQNTLLAAKFYYWYLLAIPLALVLYLLTRPPLANPEGDATTNKRTKN